MTEATTEMDFVALAQAGAELRTRDRRAVTLIAVDPATGSIRGAVGSEGELAWRRDGGYDGAPAGVAGPLDLAPPRPEVPAQSRMSLREALNDAAGAAARAPFCCD